MEQECHRHMYSAENQDGSIFLSEILPPRRRPAGRLSLFPTQIGGLTKIKQARDLCVSLGIGMKLNELNNSWGAAIAASAHLTDRTPTDDFNNYSTADGAPQRVNGRMAASKSPGLGIQPKMDVLGKRVVEVH